MFSRISALATSYSRLPHIQFVLNNSIVCPKCEIIRCEKDEACETLTCDNKLIVCIKYLQKNKTKHLNLNESYKKSHDTLNISKKKKHMIQIIYKTNKASVKKKKKKNHMKNKTYYK